MKVAKYTNPLTGETLYAEHPEGAIREIDGNAFILMSFSKNLNRPFWYNKGAVKLDRIEESK